MIHVKKLVQSVLGPRLVGWIRGFRNRKQVHLDSIFGCDFYQNNQDVIDYSKFNGLSIDRVRHMDAELNIMYRYIREGSTVIDIGANIGFYTLGMSHFTGRNGQVIAFEPGPVSYALLSRNAYANSNKVPSRIILENKAVSDRVGTSNLFINPTGESDNQIHHDLEEYIYKDEASRVRVQVDVTDLSGYLYKNDVSFIKIDTQGHEYYVLKGAREALITAKNVVLLVEYAPYLKAWENYTQKEFYSLVVSMGFDVYDVDGFRHADEDYLNSQYGPHLDGKWTTLLLKKG